MCTQSKLYSIKLSLIYISYFKHYSDIIIKLLNSMIAAVKLSRVAVQRSFLRGMLTSKMPLRRQLSGCLLFYRGVDNRCVRKSRVRRNGCIACIHGAMQSLLQPALVAA